MPSITISLPESLKAFVDSQLATGGYGNVSEYFRSLPREAQAKGEEARLESLLLEGLASKRVPLDAKFRRLPQRPRPLPDGAMNQPATLT